MESIQFGDKQLILPVMRVYNAKGEGEYFQGIAPRCPAADDLSRPLGSPDEVALREALHLLASGSCSEGTQLRDPPVASVQLIGPPPGLRTAIGLY
jgi:hypothetical protein